MVAGSATPGQELSPNLATGRVPTAGSPLLRASGCQGRPMRTRGRRVLCHAVGAPCRG
jgi:hypothetical protein